MKYIKQYENIDDSPQVGNYVICYINKVSKEVNNWLSNNIGTIITVDIQQEHPHNLFTEYTIHYKNIPNDISNQFYGIAQNLQYVGKSSIRKINKNKKELEASISAEKFNI